MFRQRVHRLTVYTLFEDTSALDPLEYSFDCNGNGNFTDLGDKANRTANTADCTFTSADQGVNTINILVDDLEGGTDTGSTSVRVNQLPTALIAGDNTVNEGAVASLDGTGSSDTDTGDTLSFQWDFGDGTAPTTGATTTHIYADGTGDTRFTVTLTVTDSIGDTDTDTLIVTVNNVPPSIVSVVPGDPVLPETGGTSIITVNATDVPADILDLLYSFDCDNDDNTGTGGFEVGPTGDNSTVCTFLGGAPPVRTVNVKVDDQDGGVDTGSTTVTVGKPAAPGIISPKNETTDVTPTFRWTGVSLAEFYDIEISTDNFATLARTITDIPDNPSTSDQSQTLSAPPLNPGVLHQWRVRGKIGTVGAVLGDISKSAAFVTSGAPVNVTLQVTLQGNPVANVVGPVLFNVGLLPISTGAPITRPGITGDGTARVYTVPLGPIPTGFYDIGIEANHTLINLKQNVAIHLGLASSVDMGELVEGNAANDTRPGVEPTSIVNGLDISMLVAVLFEKQTDPTVFDPRVDFSRDGDITEADLVLICGTQWDQQGRDGTPPCENYLKFSPQIVSQP